MTLLLSLMRLTPLLALSSLLNSSFLCNSLPAPLSPPDNMRFLLSLHNLTHLPAMLYLTYLEYSAFGEG